MSKGNCARRGYKEDCNGLFSIKSNGNKYKYCDECRKYNLKTNATNNRVKLNNNTISSTK